MLASKRLGYRWPSSIPLPPDIEPLSQSGVVHGTAVAAVSGGAVVAQNLPAVVSELERADQHLQAGTILGVVIGLLVIAGAAYALWQRVRAAKQLREGAAA